MKGQQNKKQAYFSEHFAKFRVSNSQKKGGKNQHLQKEEQNSIIRPATQQLKMLSSRTPNSKQKLQQRIRNKKRQIQSTELSVNFSANNLAQTRSKHESMVKDLYELKKKMKSGKDLQQRYTKEISIKTKLIRLMQNQQIRINKQEQITDEMKKNIQKEILNLKKQSINLIQHRYQRYKQEQNIYLTEQSKENDSNLEMKCLQIQKKLINPNFDSEPKQISKKYKYRIKKYIEEKKKGVLLEKARQRDEINAQEQILSEQYQQEWRLIQKLKSQNISFKRLNDKLLKLELQHKNQQEDYNRQKENIQNILQQQKQWQEIEKGKNHYHLRELQWSHRKSLRILLQQYQEKMIDWSQQSRLAQEKIRKQMDESKKQKLKQYNKQVKYQERIVLEMKQKIQRDELYRKIQKLKEQLKGQSETPIKLMMESRYNIQYLLKMDLAKNQISKYEQEIEKMKKQEQKLINIKKHCLNIEQSFQKIALIAVSESKKYYENRMGNEKLNYETDVKQNQLLLKKEKIRFQQNQQNEKRYLHQIEAKQKKLLLLMTKRQNDNNIYINSKLVLQRQLQTYQKQVADQRQAQEQRYLRNLQDLSQKRQSNQKDFNSKYCFFQQIDKIFQKSQLNQQKNLYKQIISNCSLQNKRFLMQIQEYQKNLKQFKQKKQTLQIFYTNQCQKQNILRSKQIQQAKQQYQQILRNLNAWYLDKNNLKSRWFNEKLQLKTKNDLQQHTKILNQKAEQCSSMGKLWTSIQKEILLSQEKILDSEIRLKQLEHSLASLYREQAKLQIQLKRMNQKIQEEIEKKERDSQE